MQHVARNIVGSRCNMLSRVGWMNATLCNIVAKHTQHVACNSVAGCCTNMLHPYGQGLKWYFDENSQISWKRPKSFWELVVYKPSFIWVSNIWNTKFFTLCDVIFLVGKFEVDHSWEWNGMQITYGCFTAALTWYLAQAHNRRACQTYSSFNTVVSA